VLLQARNTSMLAQCFYHLEDFASLTKLIEVLTEGQPLLADIGKKLQSVGLCTEAVAAFTKVRNSDGPCSHRYHDVRPCAGAATATGQAVIRLTVLPGLHVVSDTK
jgi:hypothetical protein